MTTPLTPDPAIWTHCDIHPLAPSQECTRCRDSITMNQRQLEALGLTTDAQFAALLIPTGPFSPAELNIILLGWDAAKSGNVAAVIVTALKDRP